MERERQSNEPDEKNILCLGVTYKSKQGNFYFFFLGSIHTINHLQTHGFKIWTYARTKKGSGSQFFGPTLVGLVVKRVTS